MAERPAGRYEMALTRRSDSGQADVLRWTEDLSAEEATRRFGQVEKIPDVIRLPSGQWTALPGLRFEAYQDSGQTMALPYRQTLDLLVAALPEGASLTFRRRHD